jgi:formyl-CoA transferase
MQDAVYASLSSNLGLWFGSGDKAPPRTGNRHGGMAEAPYNVYPASDGWIAIIRVGEVHWRSLACAIGQEALAKDPRFTSLKLRVEHMDEIDAIVAEWTRQRPKQESFELLTAHRVACAPVRDLDEVAHAPPRRVAIPGSSGVGPDHHPAFPAALRRLAASPAGAEPAPRR